MAQPDGYYPRLNAAMLQSGQFEGMIVSLMGRIQSNNPGNQTAEFIAADGGIVVMNTNQMELPEEMDMAVNDRPVMEAIGQVQRGQITVRCVLYTQ